MNLEYTLNYILICVLCYFVGAIPFAHILVKRKHKIKITDHGSGNVGAMNTYEVTNSKATGISVFLLDFLKGCIPALILTEVFYLSLPLIILPLSLVVLGHNYSIFLKFKGGRGLATATGIFLVINFLLVIVWCLIFVITTRIKKNVHIGNVVASFLVPFPLLIAQNFFYKFTYGAAEIGSVKLTIEFLFILSSSISLIILLKHVQPVVELMKQKFNK
jgi:glycerol-3-phosphate acyltransferase PlsY